MDRIRIRGGYPLSGEIVISGAKNATLPLMAAGLLMFTLLHVNTPLWQAFIYMLVVGVGLGSAMQPLVLAVQNDLELKDMGAGTATSTFFRSLGGAVGVAALGAVLSNKLAGIPGGAAQINAPSALLKLPAEVRATIQHLFVDALHPIFLTAGLVTLLAVVLSLAMPNKELKGAGQASPEQLKLDDEELAAIEMESQASMMG